MYPQQSEPIIYEICVRRHPAVAKRYQHTPYFRQPAPARCQHFLSWHLFPHAAGAIY